MCMVRGWVEILFQVLNTGGRGLGQNTLGGVDFVGPGRGRVHCFQTLKGNFFHALLAHI